MAHLELEYQDRLYIGAEHEGSDAEFLEGLAAIYDNFERLNKMKFVEKGGATLILGEAVIKSGVFRIVY